MAKPIELRGGLVAACTNTRPGGSSGPSGAGVLVGRGLGPTEGQTIRVGLPGRTATAEMVDRLLAALSGWPPVRCKGDVGTATVGHPAGCGDGGGWLHGRRFQGTKHGADEPARAGQHDHLDRLPAAERPRGAGRCGGCGG